MNFSSISPKKSLGQNFLIDKNIVIKIISSLAIQDNDFIVEIGPGRGALTKFLTEFPINYVGVEIDKNFFDILEEFKKSNQNYFFEIVNQSFLEFNEKYWVDKFGRDIILVGNIPYYLTSPILFKILDKRKFYHKVLLMVQREVANRLIGSPGTKDYGILSVIFQLLANIVKLFDVSPTCFYPKPKIFSTVIEVEFKENFKEYENFLILKEIVKLAFNQRRKILLNSLFKRLNFNEQIIKNDNFLQRIAFLRAEQLTPNDFLDLVSLLVQNYFNHVKRIDRRNRI